MMPKAGGQYVFLREGLSPAAGFLYGWTLFAVIQTGTIAAVAVAFARFLSVLAARGQPRGLPAAGADSPARRGRRDPARALAPARRRDPLDPPADRHQRPRRDPRRGDPDHVHRRQGWRARGAGAVRAHVLSPARRGRGEFLELLGHRRLEPGDDPAGRRGDGRLAVLQRRVEQRDLRGGRGEEPQPQSADRAGGGNRAREPALRAHQRGLPERAALLRRSRAATTRSPAASSMRPRTGSERRRSRSRSGPARAAVMAIAILFSTFGCNNGLILAGPRVYWAMARDRLFFERAGHLHHQCIARRSSGSGPRRSGHRSSASAAPTGSCSTT